MQIATLNYQYNTKDRSSKSIHPQRQIFTTVINSSKKNSFHSDLNSKAHSSLPPLKSNSIRLRGNRFQPNLFNDSSMGSFRQVSRSHSRHSDRSDRQGVGSRSITPSGTSKFVQLKFGYPVKPRSKNFYKSDLNDNELRFRENSFVNDSIRTSTEHIYSTKATHYEPFDDPNLSQFFQSPVVLNVVRKTMNINDVNKRLSQTKKHSKSLEKNLDYEHIVAKHSSGYGKLNGYDCIPSFAPTRVRRLVLPDRHQSSANSSFTSFPTLSSTQSYPRKKHSKQLTPIAASSPIRHSTADTTTPQD